MDGLIVNVRENQRVINKALYLGLAVNLEGQKELLGMWLAQTEGAKFWLSVLTERQNRGVKEIFLACVDGLTGLPQAIETVSAQTRVPLCMVHMVRNSLRYVSHKHMKEVATDWHPDLLSQYRGGSRVQSGTHGSRNGMRSIPALASPGEPTGAT